MRLPGHASPGSPVDAPRGLIETAGLLALNCSLEPRQAAIATGALKKSPLRTAGRRPQGRQGGNQTLVDKSVRDRANKCSHVMNGMYIRISRRFRAMENRCRLVAPNSIPPYRRKLPMNLIKSLLVLVLSLGCASFSIAASSTPAPLTPVPKTEEAMQATAETVAHDAARDAKAPLAKKANKKANKAAKASSKSAKTPKAKTARAKKPKRK